MLTSGSISESTTICQQVGQSRHTHTHSYTQTHIYQQVDLTPIYQQVGHKVGHTSIYQQVGQ